MTATLSEVREALQTTLEAIDGLTVYARPPGTVNPPAAIVSPADGQFLTYLTSQTSHDLDMLIAVLVQLGTRESATTNLDEYLEDAGGKSVFAAVQADPTLGGVVDSAAVTGAQNYGVITYNGVDYQGVELTVEVLL